MNNQASVKVQASPEKVFSIYRKVSEWPLWDPELLEAGLEGPFAAGSTGVLRPKRGPAVRFRLVQVSAPYAFVSESALPFCAMRVEHYIEECEGGCEIVHRVTFSGPLGFLFRRILGPSVVRGFAPALAGLKGAVESG